MSPRDPLQELQDALSFPTSPDFAARVRQQLANEPPRVRALKGASLAVAAAVALAAGVASVTVYVNRPVELARMTGPMVVKALTPVASRVDEPIVTVEPRAMRPRVARSIASLTASPFETLVPDDQRRALESLLGSMREGRTTVPPEMVQEEVTDGGERRLKAVVIEPVTVEPLPIGPRETNKDPVKDPIK